MRACMHARAHKSEHSYRCGYALIVYPISLHLSELGKEVLLLSLPCCRFLLFWLFLLLRRTVWSNRVSLRESTRTTNPEGVTRQKIRTLISVFLSRGPVLTNGVNRASFRININYTNLCKPVYICINLCTSDRVPQLHNDERSCI